jgi:hypothetical protein
MFKNNKPQTRTIVDLMQLLPHWFGGSSGDSWRAFLCVGFSLLELMPESDIEIAKRHTQREILSGSFKELWVIAGRRSGKSLIASLIAVFLACFVDHKLKPNEKAVGMIICPDRKQGRVVFNYILALMNDVPMLRSMIVKVTKEAIQLNNGITIEIHTASYRTLRGYTVVFCVIDEIAFLRDEISSNPDKEILAAVRPAMITVPNSRLICISSPYAKRSELWNTYQKHFGKDSNVLVWQAGTRDMNPTVSQTVIDAAVEADPSAASAEYLAEFRRDIESFLTAEIVNAAVSVSNPPSGFSCFGFHDAADGSGKDSMCSAISHADNEIRICDALLETRPPFVPSVAIKEHAEFFRSYGVTNVTADRYAKSYVKEEFAKHEINVIQSEKDKSTIYGECLPLFNSHRVQIPNNPRLINQLLNLERRTRAGGKDLITEGIYNDDLANVCCGSLLMASVRSHSCIGLNLFGACCNPEHEHFEEMSKNLHPSGELPRGMF